MKENIKLGVILLLFGGICAGLLAVANGYTADIIADRQAQELANSLGVVYEEADAFEEVEPAQLEEIQTANPNILNAFNALQGGETIGNVFEVQSTGYGGPFTFIVGLGRAQSAVTGFRMMEHSETPGFGAAAADEGFSETTVGATQGSEIDGITGATVTTSGIQSGVDDAFNSLGLLTGEVVAQSPEEQMNTVLQEAYPEADAFEEVSGEDGDIQSVHRAMAGGSPVGHVVVVKTPGGYGGDITFALGIDESGAVTGFRTIEHNETPGFGARMDDDEFTESILGKTDSTIDSPSGATATTNPLESGFPQAFEAAAAAE